MHSQVDSSLAERLSAGSGPARAAAALDYLREHGEVFYDESVTQLAHALQTAQLARREEAAPALIGAALLHDLGHLLVRPAAAHSGGLSAPAFDHESLAAEYLAPFFEPAVTEPIRLHVAAKRYLCAADPEYLDSLSPASVRSLKIQGGPLTPAERAQFERNPFFGEALRLRQWDDGAKVVGAETPPLDDFQAAVVAGLHGEFR